MTLVGCLLYLAACVHAARRVSGLLVPAGAERAAYWQNRALTGIVVFFALFQGGFHAVGLPNLFWQWPRVDAVTALAPVLLVLFAAEWIARRVPGDAPRTRYRLLSLRDGWGLAATAAAYCLIALLLLFQFPRGFEAQAYHLPVGVYLFQTGSFVPWDTAFMHVFTAAASIYFAFLLQFLPERIAACANLLFTIPLGLAIYGASRHLGATARASALTVSGVLTIPVVAFNFFDLTADIGGYAFLAVAIYFVLAQPLLPVRSALIAGLACGLAYSFKMFHVASIGYLLLVTAAVAAWGRREAGAGFARASLPACAVFALGALATSGFWMLRAWLQFDNPFYPLQIPLISGWFGWPHAPDMTFHPDTRAVHQQQWVTASWEWLVFPWLESASAGRMILRNNGLGAFFAATMPIAYVAVGLTLAVSGDPRKRSLAILWAGATLVSAAWWFTSREPRYLMGLLAYLAPLAAWTISRAAGRGRKIYELVVAICVLAMLFVITTREVLTFGDRIVFSRQLTRAASYEYPEIIDRLPPGSTIAHIGTRPWHYPLFGADLSNRVVSYPEMMRVLDIPGDRVQSPVPPEIHLSEAVLRQVKATHLFVAADAELKPGPCVGLEEIARMDRNPLNGQRLPAPRRVFKIELCRQQ